MIFRPSSNIDPRLAETAKDIESQEIGLRVISAQIFNLPIVKLVLSVLVQSPRRFNVLEEFVLRAASELDPAPRCQELANLLGLDNLFVDATYRNLEQLKAMTVDNQGRLVLTAVGQECYRQGRVPRPPERHPVGLIYQDSTGELSVWRQLPTINDRDPVLPGLSNRDDAALALAANTAATLQRMIQVTTEAGLGLHFPDEGRVIVEVENATIEEHGYLPYAIMVIQDMVVFAGQTDNVFVRAFNMATNRNDRNLEQALNEWLRAGRIRLTDFMPAQAELATVIEPQLDTSEKPIHTQLVEKIYQEETSAARARIQVGTEQPIPPVHSVSTDRGVVELLRDEAIWPRFMQALQQARHTLLIVSPWITDEVIDGDFRQRLVELARRRVMTLMGWGISRDYTQEEKVPSKALLDSVQSISTPDGVPAVMVWWVGNQHSKDVLVDHAIHMSGSHNWLSYRGDRLPRGESTYYVTMPEPVQKALGYVEPLFARAASTEWNLRCRLLAENLVELKRCCATWVAARQPDQAITNTLNLARSDQSTLTDTLQLMSTICLALGRLPSDDLSTMGILDLIEPVAPSFLAVARSAGRSSDVLAEFAESARQLLGRYAETSRLDVVHFLEGQRSLWEEIGLLAPGQAVADAIASLTVDKPRAETKKRSK